MSTPPLSPSPYDAQPPAGTPTAPGKRSPLPVVAVVAVAVLALVGAGVGAWALWGRGDSSASATGQGGSSSTVSIGQDASSSTPVTGSRDVSSEWVEGSHTIWELDVDDAAIDVNGNQVVVGSYNSYRDLTGVTAYDVSGSEPVQQWEAQVNHEFGYVHYWGDWIRVGGNELLAASDGTSVKSGWDKDDSPTFIGAYALTCDKNNHCTGWSVADPTTPLWEQEVNGFDYEEFDYGVFRDDWAVHDGALVALIARETAVRLEDGMLIHLDVDDGEELRPLADGWLAIDVGEDEARVLSTSGEQVDSFTGTFPEVTYLTLFESPRRTAAQFRAAYVDGDLSSATVTSWYDPDSEDDCPITLTVGEHTIVPASKDGGCYFIEDEEAWYSLSLDGSLLLSVDGHPAQTSASVGLVRMWSVADGEAVHFEGADPDEQDMWLVNPSLVIAYDEDSGRLTAYAPGKK